MKKLFSTICVALCCVLAQAQLSVTPSSLDFGEVDPYDVLWAETALFISGYDGEINWTMSTEAFTIDGQTLQGTVTVQSPCSVVVRIKEPIANGVYNDVIVLEGGGTTYQIAVTATIGHDQQNPNPQPQDTTTIHDDPITQQNPLEPYFNDPDWVISNEGNLMVMSAVNIEGPYNGSGDIYPLTVVSTTPGSVHATISRPSGFSSDQLGIMHSTVQLTPSNTIPGAYEGTIEVRCSWQWKTPGEYYGAITATKDGASAQSALNITVLEPEPGAFEQWRNTQGYLVSEEGNLMIDADSIVVYYTMGDNDSISNHFIFVYTAEETAVDVYTQAYDDNVAVPESVTTVMGPEYPMDEFYVRINMSHFEAGTHEFGIGVSVSPDYIYLPVKVVVTDPNPDSPVNPLPDGAECMFTLELYDTYGDGWNGASLNISDGIHDYNYTLDYGSGFASYNIPYYGSPYLFTWVRGNFDEECSFKVIDMEGTILVNVSSLSGVSTGEVVYAMDASPCSGEIIVNPGDTTTLCNFTLELRDSYGDGWNNASLDISDGTHEFAYTLNYGSSFASYEVPYYGNPYSITWSKGSYDSECSITIINSYGETTTTISNMTNYATGDVIYTMQKSPCEPVLTDTVDVVIPNSATLDYSPTTRPAIILHGFQMSPYCSIYLYLYASELQDGEYDELHPNTKVFDGTSEEGIHAMTQHSVVTSQGDTTYIESWITVPNGEDKRCYHVTMREYRYLGENISLRISGDTLYVDGSGWINDCTQLNYTRWRRNLDLNAIRHLVISDQITKIGGYTFYGMSYLESVHIGNSVISIGSSAFYDCGQISRLEIPASVKYIYSRAFANMGYLEEIVTNIAEHPNVDISEEAFEYTYTMRVVANTNVLILVSNRTECLVVPANSTIRDTYVAAGYLYEEAPATDIVIRTTRTLTDEEVAEYGTKPSMTLFASWLDSTQCGHLTVDAGEVIELSKFVKHDFWGRDYQAACVRYETYTTGHWVSDGNEEDHFVIGESQLGSSLGSSSDPTGGMSGGSGHWEDSIVHEVYYDFYPGITGNMTTLQNDGVISADTVVIENTYSDNRWHFFSLPFNAAMAQVVAENGAYTSTRRFDAEAQAAGDLQHVWVEMESTDTLHAGQGYIVQTLNSVSRRNSMVSYTALNDAKKNAIFSNAGQSLTLRQHVAAEPWNANWNMLANPYPMFYDIRKIANDGVVVVYNGDEKHHERGGAYAFYSIQDDYYLLQPGEAFLYQAAVGETSLNMPMVGAQHGVFSEGVENSYYWDQPMAPARVGASARTLYNFVLSAGDEQVDKTRIVFNSAASAGYEIGRDVLKMRAPGSTDAELYSEVGNSELAIQERPEDDGVAYLSVRISEAGSYTISLTDAGEMVNMLDTETGIVTDLSTSDYTFSADAATYSKRFVIGVNRIATDLKPYEVTEEKASMAEKRLINGVLYIQRGEKSYDANGKLVK